MTETDFFVCWQLTCLQVEAHRLEDRLLMLGLKAQHIEFRSPIITNEEEYRRYKDMPEDLYVQQSHFASLKFPCSIKCVSSWFPADVGELSRTLRSE